MGKREIPRGLRDVADLLKHPAISQEVKQQLVAQLSPEDLAKIGYKPPKPAPLAPAVQSTALVEPRQVSIPPPLKLVTSWPVEILELEPNPCEDAELEVEEVTAVCSDRLKTACLMAPTSWGSNLVSHTQNINSIAVSIAFSWPFAVIAASLMLLVFAGMQTTCGVGN